MPGRKDTMIRALGNVRPSHLIDRKLFDFAALRSALHPAAQAVPMRFDDRDIGWLAGVLADAAVAEIMPRFRRLGAGDIRQKTSAADLVTEADVNAERVITAAIAERYPGCADRRRGGLRDRRALLPRLGAAELAFVIDPVDGTFNFASGVPLFGVMVAVVQDGETVAGIIHDPVGKDFLIGARGAGSHIVTADGAQVPVTVAAPVPMSEMTGAVSWQYRRRAGALAAGEEPGQVPVAYRLSLRRA